MADAVADPSGPFSEDAFFARLEAGEVGADEQQRFAAALRGDAALRRRLRQRLSVSSVLVRAARPVAAKPLTGGRPSGGAFGHSRGWTLAAAALLALGLGAVGVAVIAVAKSSDAGAGAGGLAATDDGTTPRATDEPPAAVAASGPFTLDERRGALVLPDTSRVDLEAGSSGDISHQPASASLVRLDTGGARLRAPAAGGSVHVQTGPAQITITGDAAVRYLDVPEGAQQAVEVAVTNGSAQIDTPGGHRHLLHVGDTHVVVPGGALKARVARVDPALGTVQLNAGPDRRRWTITVNDAPPVVADGAPFPIGRLEPDWKVVVQVDPGGATITRIDVPAQTTEVLLVSWDPVTRIVRARKGQHQPVDEWTLAEGQTIAPALLTHQVRLTFDPATRIVSRLAVPGRKDKAEGDVPRKGGAAH